uniref:Uncharacterized protein n=1 Tax=Sphaerodactylus townsendi TaxID=933632 RepID=A0ACB8EET3_9SAUR
MIRPQELSLACPPTGNASFVVSAGRVEAVPLEPFLAGVGLDASPEELSGGAILDAAFCRSNSWMGPGLRWFWDRGFFDC